MALYKGFDKENFMEYMEETFVGFSGFDGAYLRELVENIINYAHKWEHVSKDQFVEFLDDMLPCVTFGEIAMFCEDAILTENGKDQKYMELAKRGLPITEGPACN